MESDIRNADRDLRDIETLDKKGVTAAGRLEGVSFANARNVNVNSCERTLEHESLQPRLDKLVRATKEDLAMYLSLESRVARVLEQYTSQVRPRATAAALCSCVYPRWTRFRSSSSLGVR